MAVDTVKQLRSLGPLTEKTEKNVGEMIKNKKLTLHEQQEQNNPPPPPPPKKKKKKRETKGEAFQKGGMKGTCSGVRRFLEKTV